MTFPTRYMESTITATEVGGKRFEIVVHWAMVEGRATCVGLDVRSFHDPLPKPGTKPYDTEWHEVNSSIIRQLRTAEIIESTREAAWGLAEREAARPVDHDPIAIREAFTPEERADFHARSAAAAAAFSRSTPRRGPKRLWSDQVLAEVVTPAYLRGGSKPLEAVRSALEVHSGKPVTTEQARKAAARARTQGLLPAARNRRRA